MTSKDYFIGLQNNNRSVIEKFYEKYEQKLKNLREQLANLQITTQEYNSKTKQLQEQMESFEKLIFTMAEHYARTDYDNLDPLNAEINRCIVAGELERADSLINTKGDIIERAYENIKKGNFSPVLIYKDNEKIKDFSGINITHYENTFIIKSFEPVLVRVEEGL